MTITRQVVGPPGTSAGDVVPGTSVYGTGKLRVTLAMNGVIVAGRGYAPPDGFLSWEVPLWRVLPRRPPTHRQGPRPPPPPGRPAHPARLRESRLHAPH